MKLGFIGVGNMSTAIIRSVIESGYIKNDDVYIFDGSIDITNKRSQEFHITACQSIDELVKTTDCILLGVKPQVLKKILSEIGPLLTKNDKVLISIAAGVTTGEIYSLIQSFNSEQEVIRVMPNLNALVGESASAIASNEFSIASHLEFVEGLFNSIGKSWRLDENFFSVFTAISGSMPAYIFLLIDSIARSGVKYGLSKQVADEIALQVVSGSAKSLKISNESAWSMIDKVSSPGGTTVAGLLKLIERGFVTDIIDCVDTTIEKDKSLNNE